MLPVDVRPRDESLVDGHLFGSWLEVRPSAEGRDALETACLLEQVGETETAIQVLGDAIEDDACAELFEARGALYLTTGYPRAAAGDFQRAVALRADSPDCWYALGHAYEVLGLANQALESLNHARALGREEPDLLLSLARVLRSLGRSGLAARSYATALELTEQPTLDLLIEASSLALDHAQRAPAVENLRDRLEACLGVRHSEQAWMLRALMREMPGRPFTEVTSAVRAMEPALDEVQGLTRWNLVTLQLLDTETATEARRELFAGVTDDVRREALQRCLRSDAVARRQGE